jgi:hypothetical protein
MGYKPIPTVNAKMVCLLQFLSQSGGCGLIFGFGKKIMDGCKNRSVICKTYFSIYKSYSTFY